MKFPLKHSEWQLLRQIVREGPCSTEQLKCVWRRSAKNGEHLKRLVKLGVLEVNVDGEYRITPLGQEGAEYGEIEIDFALLKKLKIS